MQTDWNFLGNQWAVRLLQGQLKNDALSHAYLFTGPKGIGRRSLALSFAKAINCQNPPEPGLYCGECRACRGLEKAQHPDLHLVEVLEGDRKIKIEAVRELSKMLSLTPIEAKKQIALLLEFENASLGAANALLKTLEEPSSSAMLMITAESAESLLSTTASRCEQLRLRPMKREELARILAEREGAEMELARRIAALSAGRPGLAQRLLKDEGELEKREQWLAELQELLGASKTERFAYARSMSWDRAELAEMLSVWLAWWRELLLFREGVAEETGLLQKADSITIARKGIDESIERLRISVGRLSTNVDPKLALESLLISLPKWPN